MKADAKLSAEARDEARGCFEQMDMGDDADGKGSWWEWVAPALRLLGLAMSCMNLAVGIKAMASGVVLGHLGATAGTTAVATPVGLAIVLGFMAAAALYYFVPWKTVFGWLKRVFSTIWERMCQSWKQFWGWLKGSRKGATHGRGKHGLVSLSTA